LKTYHKRCIKIFAVLMVSLSLFNMFTSEVKAEKESSQTISSNKKICTLIVLDRVSINDIEKLPNLKKLIEKGSIGLMNTKCAGNFEPAGCYLTIGAGTRASASGKGKLALMEYEIHNGFKGEKIYKNLTGNEVYGKILVPEIPLLIEENLKQDHEIVPGLLGETLKSSGITVSLLGNADTFDEKNRLAALIAMDGKGQIFNGKIDINPIYDEESPFFFTTNYERMYEEYLKLRSLGGLIVIYIGDLVRADEYYKFSDKTRGYFLRFNSLKKADTFIGKITNTVNFSRELLIVVTPFPSYWSIKNKEYLTPLIISGNNIKKGLVISDTTKRPGIVANIDIAPTILSFFDLKVPYPMLGKAIKSFIYTNTLSYLINLNKKITMNYISRPYIIKTYVFMQIFGVILFLSYIFKLFFVKPNWLIYFFLFNLTVPAALLFPFIFEANSLSNKILILTLTSFIITIISILISKNQKNPIYSITFICMATSLLISFDLLFQAKWMKNSLLGYDVIGGARYYGIGNEYMGVLFSSTIMGISSFFEIAKVNESFKKVIMGLLFFTIFFMISSPYFGSNVGGAIASFGAFLTTYILYFYKISDYKIYIKNFVISSIVLAIILIIFCKFGPQSHLTLLVFSLKSQGLKPLYLVVIRKLSMNYRLFKYTPWTKALLFSLLTLLILTKWPVGFFKKMNKNYPFLFKGIAGTSFGTFLALVFNDSGIVAAATSMIFSCLPVLILSIKEIGERR